jgi:transposase InsO family protein
MTQQEVIAKTRRSLLIYAQRNGIATACRVFDVSRTTYYKIKKQFIDSGTLEPQPRRKPRMPTETRLSKKKLILKYIHEHPADGPGRIAYSLRQDGIAITHQAVWYCLRRFGLNKKFQRLLYLEQLKALKQPLTEKTLRMVKRRMLAVKHGQWPGHIVALDTFFVGNLKGVGRIYQMTGIDLCSRYGWAKLYTSKEQASSADFLEHWLLPKFFYNKVDVEQVLTDNGTEFTGRKFQGALEAYGIKHLRIPPGKPIYNGYCERFQRTILEELYQKLFRTKVINTIKELSQELEKYLIFYNFERPHFGLHRDGAKPIDAFTSKTSFLRHRFQKLLT